ncbi:MAG: NYN domain-containing protein [Acidimicrobiia bacterium]
MTNAPTGLLRPALEAAVTAARTGEEADLALPAPPALRRYLRFARLPMPALDVARKVVEEDDDFRHRVAAGATEADVGEAGWLWLHRPDGWEARLDLLARRAQEIEHHEQQERVERDTQKRLAGAEDRARRAEASVSARGGELAEARSRLAAERAAREAADAALVAAAEQVAALGAQRNGAVRQLKEAEAELARRSAELRQARHEIRMHQAELEGSGPPAPAPALSPPAPLEPLSPPTASPAGGVDPVVQPDWTEGAGRLDRGTSAGSGPSGAARAVGDAAIAARHLADALAAAAEALDTGSDPGAVRRTGPDASSAPAPASVPVPEAAPRVEPLARRAARLPTGMFDDSTQAVEHLLRLPGVLVLVDGYNVSQEAWPGSVIADQRSRLLGAVAEVQARTGAEIEVVFDGSDDGAGVPVPSRPSVMVRYSPTGVEADEVLLERMAATAPARPVVLVSNDRRLGERARRLGANLVRPGQLLGARHR